MRCNDDGVASLDRRDSLDHRCRLRIGGRRQGTNDTDRLGNLHNIAYRVFLDHTNRLVTDDIHQRGARFAMDLEVLALVVPQLGFFHREARDFFRAILAGHGPHHGGDQFVDLRLGVVFDLLLGSACPRHHGCHFRLCCLQCLLVFHWCVLRCG